MKYSSLRFQCYLPVLHFTGIISSQVGYFLATGHAFAWNNVCRVAIAGSSEIIGVIALLPAVMNSFLFLASVKRIVEHREVKARPTILTDDFR